MSNPSEEEPKIIIDEDWKTQVEREKAEFKAKQEAGGEKPSDSTETAADQAMDGDPNTTEEAAAESTSEAAPPPPPASLEFLVSSLATQAMASLGQIPGEDGKPMPKNLDYARHFIDLIGVLEEKTKGNLEPNEEQFLQSTLHQMRMIFVQASQQS